MGCRRQWKSGVGRVRFRYLSGSGSLFDGTKSECKVICEDEEKQPVGMFPSGCLKWINLSNAVSWLAHAARFAHTDMRNKICCCSMWHFHTLMPLMSLVPLCTPWVWSSLGSPLCCVIHTSQQMCPVKHWAMVGVQQMHSCFYKSLFVAYNSFEAARHRIEQCGWSLWAKCPNNQNKKKKHSAAF